MHYILLTLMEHLEKKEEAAVIGKKKITVYLQQFNLFKKPIFIQYIILLCWILAASLYLYYEIYIASTLDMVKLSVLPGDPTWFLYSSLIFLISACIILIIYPQDQSIQSREAAKSETVHIIKKVEAMLLQKEYSASLDILSSHFELLKKYKIKENVEIMLDLVKKARINKEVQEKIEKFDQLLNTEKQPSTESRKEFLDFQLYLSQNRQYVLNELLAKADMIARKMLSQY